MLGLPNHIRTCLFEKYVDGKPQVDGTRSFLVSRRIELAVGESGDSPEAETTRGLSGRKDRYFTQRLREEGVEPYPGSVRYLEAVKTAPDTFLTAAWRLGVDPVETAVFEDALAGVAAGRAGNSGFVVGVGRTGRADELRRRGADIVVNDLERRLEH